MEDIGTGAIKEANVKNNMTLLQSVDQENILKAGMMAAYTRPVIK